MPYCPHCGQEVGEGVEYCRDCGQRLKKGFTAEERDKYIQELQTSVEEGKSDEKAILTNKQSELEAGIAESQPPFILGQEEKLVLDAPSIAYYGVSIHSVGAFGGGTYGGLFGGIGSSKQVKREKSIWDTEICHAYLTNLRMVFVKAKIGFFSKKESKLENVFSDISLDSIQGIVSGSKVGNPTIELAVKIPDGSVNNIAFGFIQITGGKARPPERDAWIKMIEQYKRNVDKVVSGTGDDQDPLKVLKMRYAKGEITKEEYEQIRQDLT